MSESPARCNLLVIRARDLDRARAFYEAIGMAFVEHSHGSGPLHLASEAGDQVFEIYPLREQDNPTSSVRLGFCVRTVDGAYRAVLNAGGESLSSPRASIWGRRAVVVDPDGHRVELTERG